MNCKKYKSQTTQYTPQRRDFDFTRQDKKRKGKSKHYHKG